MSSNRGSHPGLLPLQLHIKATTAILEVSPIPAHAQSSNVLNHGAITHFTGAPYHHLPFIASGDKVLSEQSLASIDGDTLFGHNLFPT